MNRYKNIIAYFKDNFEIDATDLKNLITHYDSVYKQVSHYAHLLYHSMEQNNSWGDPGEQQVKVSFAEIAAPDATHILTQADAIEFMNQVENNQKKKVLNKFLGVEAKAQLKQYTFKTLGQRFEAYKAHQMTQLMHFIGSNDTCMVDSMD